MQLGCAIQYSQVGSKHVVAKLSYNLLVRVTAGSLQYAHWPVSAQAFC